MEIIDHTETNLIALRRTIYLTIQSRLFSLSSLYYSSIYSFTHSLRLSLIFILSLSFFHSHSFIFILSFSFFHFHSFIFIISFFPFSFFLFSSLDFEECAHKLLKMQLKDEQLVSYLLFAFCRLSHRTKFQSRP